MELQSPYRAVESPPDAQVGTPDWLAWVLNYALLSPSPHNTQPWRWQIAGTVVRLRADRTRTLTVSDSDGRELAIGCGSAVEHLLIALGHFGVRGSLELLPDAQDPDLLAEIDTGAGDRLPDEQALFAALPLRRTNRMGYSAEPVGAAQIEQIVASIVVPGVHATVAGDSQREVVRELVMQGDRVQMADSAFRRELSSWMRAAHSHRDDGMPADLLGQHGVAAEVAPLAVRTFDLGKGQSAKDGELLDGSPVIAVVWSDQDDVEAWLNSGRYLARLALSAQAAGVASAHMNQPCELPELRGRLAAELKLVGHPQLVLRLGNAPAVHESPRRPLAELLDVDG